MSRSTRWVSQAITALALVGSGLAAAQAACFVFDTNNLCQTAGTPCSGAYVGTGNKGPCGGYIEKSGSPQSGYTTDHAGQGGYTAEKWDELPLAKCYHVVHCFADPGGYCTVKVNDPDITGKNFVPDTVNGTTCTQ